MKLGVLFSGGKDSAYAFYKAKKENEIAVLITIDSKNQDSYMFHTPINKVKTIADKIKIPLITIETEGKKEEELEDLKEAIKKSINEYKIEGIVTGAIASTYQSTRIQKICDELNILCFNPLWQKPQEELMNELLDKGFKIKIIKVAADGLDESWVGKIIDKQTLKELTDLSKKHGFNIAGEGGEYETTVEEFPDE